ncbi:MAG: hypothetical protein ABRQ23_06550 [Syntrophomonadaceae bacterium]
MPGRDGTGPMGAGGGLGSGRQGKRRGAGGRVGSPLNAGRGVYCKCPDCGEKMLHQMSQPCNEMKCPQCGSAMIRE